MSWKIETFGTLLTESRIPSDIPDVERRIRVKLNVQGVEKRPLNAEKEGATNQFIRKAGQFIYGKQNFHKGAFGIVPEELDGYETSADIPSFDVREDCLPEWIYYFFKAGNRYLELVEYARGVGSKRIHPKQLADYEIPLPSVAEQEKIIKELQFLESNGIDSELTHQLDLVKQLRQAFLREAMQGKLTAKWRENNPDVESASELLKKINAEKERLVKEGKFKKGKPLPPIKEDEIPFEIADSWIWCRLNDVCQSIVDCPHSTPQYIETKTDYFGIDTNCINEKGEIIKLRGLSYESYIARTSRITPQESDLVYSREGSIGLAAFIPPNKNICLGQRVMLFRPSQNICALFLRFIVTDENYKNRLLAKHRGMGAKHINVKDIVSSLVPFPPLSEQQQIVTKLDELMQTCDKLEESIKTSQQQNEMLLQQVLREALEVKK